MNDEYSFGRESREKIHARFSARCTREPVGVPTWVNPELLACSWSYRQLQPDELPSRSDMVDRESYLVELHHFLMHRREFTGEYPPPPEDDASSDKWLEWEKTFRRTWEYDELW